MTMDSAMIAVAFSVWHATGVPKIFSMDSSLSAGIGSDLLGLFEGADQVRRPVQVSLGEIALGEVMGTGAGQDGIDSPLILGRGRRDQRELHGSKAKLKQAVAGAGLQII